MKRISLLMAVVLVGTMCFAQKSNVNKAKNLAANTESPDFAGARAAIKLALEDSTTKDLADTWYQAGMIGYKENEYLFVKSAVGPIDERAKGEAVAESYNYWLTADELSLIPNEKGKVNKRIHQSITTKMLEYYTQQELVKYGIYLNDQKEFQRAYEVFKMHLDMPDLKMMQDPKLQEKMPKDSIYNQYKFYMGLFATQAQLHKEAIDVFEEMKDGDYEAISVNQFLYQEYVELKDTVGFVRVLKDAIVRFPSEPWFLQNLINYYIYSNQEEQAVAYLETAIEREPGVAQYYHIKGNLEESMGIYDEAINDFQMALSIQPDLADAEAGIGRVYYNQAVKLNDEAFLIQDNSAYKAKLQEVDAMFAKSLPFFEKAHSMDPEKRDYIIVLKQLYYRLKMNDKYSEMETLLNQ